jgi:hypothetical protein
MSDLETSWLANSLARERMKIVALEAHLLDAEENLLAYKDYYGTSLAQVKHLQGCPNCYLGIDADQVRCSDYPSE